MTEPAETPGPGTITYAQAGDLAGVRAFVIARGHAWGLRSERVEMLALAVSELVTNTLQHTGAGGLVRVWSYDGQLVCDVEDSEPASRLPQPRRMPGPEAVRGRGLAIVEQICDEVELVPGTDGIRVRVRFTL